MTDNRPSNCRFRLQDDGKPYPRSGHQACNRTITAGLGKECHLTAMKRAPFPYGKYGSMEIMESAAGNGHDSVSMYVKHITAEQAREAAHLLNQLAEYLEST